MSKNSTYSSWRNEIMRKLIKECHKFTKEEEDTIYKIAKNYGIPTPNG